MRIPDREYWQERFAALEEAVHRQGLSVYGDIEKQYRRAMAELDKELAAWFQKFMQDNKVTFAEAKRLLQGRDLEEFRWTADKYIAIAKKQDLPERWQQKLNNASARVHVSRLEAIFLQLQQHLEVLFGNQLDTLDKAMRERYSDSYYKTAFTIQQGFGIGHSFAQVDTNRLDAVLAKPWAADGKNFSDRVWEHKDKLVAVLEQEMTQAVIRGDDYRRASDNIARRMNVSKSAAGRLVMTESAFFAAKAQQDCFKELEVEQYEFIATLDSRTSDLCRSMDGKVFKLTDMLPGTTAPPLHCHCRSCTAPYFEDAEDAERIARGTDGKTYMVSGDITYKDWKRKFVENGQESDNDGIINNKQSGALNDTNDPDGSKRLGHAGREYARIINNGKSVFVDKIAANTGLSKRLIGIVFDHVFVQKHLLYEGLSNFPPSFDMALSFQRLKEGNYLPQDIVLLRHEYLEHAIEKRFTTDYATAHGYAEKHFDYARLLRGWCTVDPITFRTKRKS